MAALELQPQTPTISDKLHAVVVALRSTLTGTYPDRRKSVVYDYHPSLREREETIEDQVSQLLSHIDSHSNNGTVYTLRSRTKGYIFALYSAFTNQHSLQIPGDLAMKEETRELTRRLFYQYRITGQSLDLRSQYEIAAEVLEEFENDHTYDLFDVLHVLHMTVRRMARGFDDKINGHVSLETMRHAKKVFAPLVEGSDDTAGDAYHFWGAFGMTVLSSVRFHERDRILNPIYQVAPQIAAWVTKHIVYRFGANEGGIHPAVDTMGVAAGKALSPYTRVRQ